MLKPRVTALSVFLLGMAFALSGHSPAREVPQDPALQEVRKAVEEARREIGKFRDGGGKNDDAKHPALLWRDRLLEYRKKYTGTEAAGLATTEALHFLFHSGRVGEVLYPHECTSGGRHRLGAFAQRPERACN